MSEDAPVGLIPIDPGRRILFDVTVVIPKGTKNKYELDHNTGRIRLDRSLFTSAPSPYHYGVGVGANPAATQRSDGKGKGPGYHSRAGRVRGAPFDEIPLHAA